jgi:hypothetical protein
VTPVAEAVQKAVIAAYYPAALSEANSARSRAQNGYTIAAAIAAAIVAAGVFGDVAEESDLVQGLGFAALVLWLLAAVLFISAVAGRSELPQSATAADAEAFVVAALERARTESAEIEKRLGRALLSTYAAVAATLLALGFALATSAPVGDQGGRLVLTKAGSATVGAICGGSPEVVAARMNPDDLGADFAEVTLERCGGKGERRETRLAKGDIAGFAMAP